MTAAFFVLAAAGGALGRYAVSRFICSWQALLVVNTAGAALLGLITSRDVSSATATIIGIGLCGALTTFSSFALEVRQLGLPYGLVYAASTVVCVTGAASLATTL
ncbi:MAG: CrcB protein [Ilumatobacter sp.]|jgi:CrcB protein